MEAGVPYAMAAIGALEGHILATRFLGSNYAGMCAAFGAHFYVLSTDTWVRRYGVGMTYVWLGVITMWLVALEYS